MNREGWENAAHWEMPPSVNNGGLPVLAFGRLQKWSSVELDAVTFGSKGDHEMRLTAKGVTLHHRENTAAVLAMILKPASLDEVINWARMVVALQPTS